MTTKANYRFWLVKRDSYTGITNTFYFEAMKNSEMAVQASLSKSTKNFGVGFLSWKGIAIDDHEAERNAKKKIEGKW